MGPNSLKNWSGTDTLKVPMEEYLIPQPGEEILYLGAGHGTTISHLHDVVCGYENSSQGRILALDHAPRWGLRPPSFSQYSPRHRTCDGRCAKHKLMEHDDSQWCSVDVSRCQSSRTS